jgi:prophage DNA circulation protein
MTWKDSLRPASFRGAAFHMDDRSHETGRRIHNHEYPKRDLNFAEDMGRRTRTWSVNAYVIGEDYMALRVRLIAACERQGPGTYVDRWRGSQQAVCEQITLTETEHEGRWCRFSIRFIAAGSQPSALGIAAAAAQAIGAAASLSGAAIASFASSAIVQQLVDPQRLGELGGTDRVQSRSVDGTTVWLGRVIQK